MVSAGDSIIPEFTEKIGMLNCSGEFDQTKERILGRRNKSKIIFKGIKTSQGNMTANLKSLKDFSCFILDEAEEMPSFEDWEKIMLSIRATDVQNLNVIIMNPAVREHWVYKEFFEEAEVEEGWNGIKGSTMYIHTTYKDCPREYIPDSVYNKIKKAEISYNIYRETPKDQRDSLRHKIKKEHRWYKNVILGGWLDAAEGVIYEDWKVGEFDESLSYVHGIDFGSNDPDALVKIAVDRKNMLIYVEEKYFKNNTGTAQLMEILHDRVGTVDLIIGDSASRRIIKDFRVGTYGTDGKWLAGLNIKPVKKKEVATGIKTLQGYTFIVHPKSKNIKKALRNYVWKDSKAGVPDHNWSDLPDAIRYGALRLII